MLKYSENLPFGLSFVSDSVVRKTHRVYGASGFKKIKTLLDHFISNPHHLVVPVYAFESLSDEGEVSRHLYHYQYDMKRLFIVSDEEKNLFDIYFRFHKLYPDVRKIKLNEYKDHYPDLYRFCQEVEKRDFYADFHSGNFLKDECGQYLLIDIEGFKPIEQWGFK